MGFTSHSLKRVKFNGYLSTHNDYNTPTYPSSIQLTWTSPQPQALTFSKQLRDIFVFPKNYHSIFISPSQLLAQAQPQSSQRDYQKQKLTKNSKEFTNYGCPREGNLCKVYIFLFVSLESFNFSREKSSLCKYNLNFIQLNLYLNFFSLQE